MENRRIAIVGAGVGGLAAGIYGQLNGFETHVFEAQPAAGGQCSGWQRKGYRFDAPTLEVCEAVASVAGPVVDASAISFTGLYLYSV